MSGRLGIDFGTSNTVIAAWDESKGESKPIHIPEYGILQPAEDGVISIIPSLIHYTSDNRRWIGNQVSQQGLLQSNRTFRWMKRYISYRSPLKVRLDGKDISPFTAGQDFLTSILVFAAQQIDTKDEEVAFSVPVEAYEHYENWLTSVAESVGILRFRLIDEPSAAALGYGSHILPGNVYLVFDFGGGTVHASVILIESESGAATGRRCRVLGKAGRDLGGASIDQWLYEDFLKLNSRRESDESIRRVSNALLVECELVKQKLSFEDKAGLTLMDPDSGMVSAAEWTRSRFEEILDEHGLFTEIDRTIRSALNSAREKGYQEDDIRAVLMVGGSSQIPSVQRIVRQIFGKERVSSNRPLDAVARGAATFVAGVDFYDQIQHDYAIRFVNPQSGKYDFRPIVQHGTPYPTTQPVARLVVKAAYEGQKQLGLAIFEMGERKISASQSVELVFDPGGAARIVQVSPDEQEQRSLFWMNESSPTFLLADPPASQGESRFEVEFNIDAVKRLVITVRDLKTGRLTHQNYPVIKLT